MGKMEFGDYAKMCKGSGSDMSYEDYKKNAVEGGLSYLKKAAFEKAMALHKAEEGEDDDEDEEGDDKVEKSVDVGDLLKSIAAYADVEDALVDSGAGASRESYLTSRMDSGTITKSEQAELGRIWAGLADEPTQEPIRKSLAQQIADDNPAAGEMVDASDLLKSWVDSIDSSLSDLGGEVSRDGVATRQLIKAQGAVIRQSGAVLAHLVERLEKSDKVIDALAQRLDLVSRQPAPRRSVGRHNPRDVMDRDLAKSVNGGGPKPTDQLTKSQIQAGLRTLVKSAADRNDEQALTVLSKATAKWEQGFGLPTNIHQAIKQLHG